MIERLVKITCIEGKGDEFLSAFRESKPVILTFEGCRSVNVLRDVKNKDVYFTYSVWDNETALDAYRKSPFFEKTWKRVKPLFGAKAEAWSTEKVS